MILLKKEEGMAIVDAHADIPYHLLQRREDPETFKNTHLSSLKRGGVNLVIANVYTDQGSPSSLKEALLEIALFQEQVSKEASAVILTEGEEIEKALKVFPLSFFLSLEGLEPLGEDPLLLSIFYQLGVRIASLTWNNRNAFAAGVMAKGGLTSLGEEVLRRMEDLGMLLDLSHLNEEGFWEALEIYKGPALVSHSNAYTIYPHPRNLKDDQLRAVAKRGGVIGLNNYMSAEVSTLDTYMEHLYYMVELLGEDHIGLGFDFNSYLGLSLTPGMEDHSCALEIGRKMEEEGFSFKTIKKILGENMVQLLERVL